MPPRTAQQCVLDFSIRFFFSPTLPCKSSLSLRMEISQSPFPTLLFASFYPRPFFGCVWGGGLLSDNQSDLQSYSNFPFCSLETQKQNRKEYLHTIQSTPVGSLSAPGVTPNCINDFWFLPSCAPGDAGSRHGRRNSSSTMGSGGALPSEATGGSRSSNPAIRKGSSSFFNRM